MKKNTHPITLVIIGLLVTAMTESLSVKLATANPYTELRQVPPPVNPTINFTSPAENNTLLNSNRLTMSFNVAIKSESYSVWITNIYYKTSWQSDNITIYRRSADGHDAHISEYSRNLTLTGIPEGKQTVTITVKGEGEYGEGVVHYYFLPTGSSTIGFTIDTTPPTVSILQSENETYAELEVPLNFTVNESVSQISYVLDGQENVTIDGNTTLTGLTNGPHNLTIYAWDNAGNIGVSETVTFTVAEPEPFPTAPVAVASVATVSLVGVGLLIHFKKRKR
jgi:hypothetical protein